MAPTPAHSTIVVLALAPVSPAQATTFITTTSLDDVDLSQEGEEPAVIVLAERTATPSPSLAPILSKLAARSSEYEVALLVSLPSSSTADPIDLDEDTWDDLGLDHTFEWVDLPSLEPAPQASSPAPPDTEDGLSRVVSALHSHMWESMIRTPTTSTTTTATHSATPLDSRGAPLLATAGEHDFDVGDEDELEEALGAPPLPDPKPYVPVEMEFPETFLPMVERKGKTATKGIDFTKLPVMPSGMGKSVMNGNEGLSSGVVPPSVPSEEEAFEDDFSPFVSAPPESHPSSSTFPPLASPTLPSTTSNTNITEEEEDDDDDDFSTPAPTDADYRHPSFSFPDDVSSFVPLSDFDGDDPDNDAIPAEDTLDETEREREAEIAGLEAMFAHLDKFRHEAMGMEDLEGRRKVAERALRGLGLWDEGSDGGEEEGDGA
ncbi:hypothetical protein MNV49_000879 [Pseudohyphozyma bogoriensis]|nr:hypothetical protein MNV49_000879 [Pseudohyphozyma bogoriensis]